MTVTYTHAVATGRGFGNFWKLLCRWRGSIYKVVVPDLIMYSICFYVVNLMYRFWIRHDKDRKHTFEKLVQYCEDYAGVIPVSFVLGFYVSQIVTRWWNQFMAIPWPDSLALLVASTVHGNDEESRLMKRTIMRYINVTYIMAMIMISPQAKARFPTNDHLVDAGFLMPHEKAMMDKISEKTELPLYFVPLIWAGKMATRARRMNKIREDFSMVKILDQLTRFRSDCGNLLGYDWVCIPLVYTQVVTLAVYLYFIAALFGKQFIDGEHELDIYVPVFLFLEFFFYTGWLKVAETMLNPFGEDDDDFEVNWMIDRNFQISFIIVDEMHDTVPEMVRDKWWDEVVPGELPYTHASKKKQRAGNHFVGSTALSNFDLDDEMTEFVANEHREPNAASMPKSTLESTYTESSLPGEVDVRAMSNLTGISTSQWNSFN